MAESVLSENEVSINAVRYPITGPVQRSMSSVWPQKLVTGDYTKDSSPILSTLALTDHRGGIGLDIMEGQGDTDRSYISYLDTRFKGVLLSPPNVYTTSSTGLTGITSFGVLCEFKAEVYAHITATSAGIYKYNNTTDSWGSRLQATGVATDAVSGRIGGTDYIVFCDASNFYYSTDGAAWTTDTTNASFLAIWDDKLWGIDSTGQLWYVTIPGGAIINDAKLELPIAAMLKGLFVGKDASGVDVLYVITSYGLFAHDFDNGRFRRTGFQLPGVATASAASGAFATSWRDKIYVSGGGDVWEYVASGESPITNIGLNRNGGNFFTSSIVFSMLRPSFMDLIAYGTYLTTGFLLAYDGRGWRILDHGNSAKYITAILVSGAYGDYRLWYGVDNTVSAKCYYLKLPKDGSNPIFGGSTFSSGSDTHTWPWFTAGQQDVTKVAVRLKVDTKDCGASDTVTVSYTTDYGNYNPSFTDLTAITTDGVTTFNLPSTASPTGISFRGIQFKVALRSGAEAPEGSVKLLSLTMEYYKKLDPKYQFLTALDLTKPYKGQTPKAMWATLLTAMETATLVEFTYRDPGSNTDATFYVQVRPQVSKEATGLNEQRQTQLLLVEV